MWKNLLQFIDSHQSFILTTHQNPDGDGVGSACALTEFLLAKRKNVRFICDSPIPRKFAFLDYHGTHELYNSHSDFQDIDAVIVLDAHKLNRIGSVSNLVSIPTVQSFCIDHHEREDSFTPNVIIDTEACSAGSMLYSFFKSISFPLNKNAATGIYTSILCDTGRFCYSSTNHLAYVIAQECVELGVEPDTMYSRLFQHISLAEAKLFARALQTLETYYDGVVVFLTIKSEDCEQLGEDPIDLEHLDLDFIHDFDNLIEGVKCFALFREYAQNKIRVSLRSKDGLDISPIVHALGGGGHSSAGGLTWIGTVTDIKTRLLALLENPCSASNNHLTFK